MWVRCSQCRANVRRESTPQAEQSDNSLITEHWCVCVKANADVRVLVASETGTDEQHDDLTPSKKWHSTIRAWPLHELLRNEKKCKANILWRFLSSSVRIVLRSDQSDFDQTWFVLYFFITIIKTDVTELRSMWLFLTCFITNIVRFISLVILKIMLIAKRIAC